MSAAGTKIHDFDDSGKTITVEQVVTQLQREVFTLKAQVAAHLDLLMQDVASTISRQLKVRRTLRVSST